MFGGGKKLTPSAASGNGAAIEGLAGERMQITGDIRFAGIFVIEGRVKGVVQAEEGSDGVLKLYERGQLEGQVLAPSVEIDGQMQGDVTAERLKLGPTARVRGNIYYRVLEMAAGAQVSGQMVHQDEPRLQLPKPEGSS
jgi:cytoskeletal protein CcmA (bactofilin family)